MKLNIKTVLTFDLKTLNREVAKANRKALTSAAKEVARAEKSALGPSTAAVSRPGETPKSKDGDLRKSIKYEVLKTVARVGSVKPLGNHGHLLRYGTKARRTKAGRYTGKVAPRMFPVPVEKLSVNLPEKWRGTI